MNPHMVARGIPAPPTQQGPRSSSCALTSSDLGLLLRAAPAPPHATHRTPSPDQSAHLLTCPDNATLLSGPFTPLASPPGEETEGRWVAGQAGLWSRGLSPGPKAGGGRTAHPGRALGPQVEGGGSWALLAQPARRSRPVTEGPRPPRFRRPGASPARRPALTTPSLSRDSLGRDLCGGPGRGAGRAVDHHLHLHHPLPAQRVLQCHRHPLQGGPATPHCPHAVCVLACPCPHAILTSFPSHPHTVPH